MRPWFFNDRHSVQPWIIGLINLRLIPYSTCIILWRHEFTSVPISIPNSRSGIPSHVPIRSMLHAWTRESLHRWWITTKAGSQRQAGSSSHLAQPCSGECQCYSAVNSTDSRDCQGSTVRQDYTGRRRRWSRRKMMSPHFYSSLFPSPPSPMYCAWANTTDADLAYNPQPTGRSSSAIIIIINRHFGTAN